MSYSSYQVLPYRYFAFASCNVSFHSHVFSVWVDCGTEIWLFERPVSYLPPYPSL